MTQFKLVKFKAVNFRNLQDNIITFNNGINCIFGENGNGKTNILEALNILATKKSFRKKASFPHYLSFDCEQPEIILSATLLDQKNNYSSYSSKIDAGSFTYSLNGKVTKKRPRINIVFINPFDSYDFHNTANFRRSFFDKYISQIDREYKSLLSKYNTALKFRNTLLQKKPSKYLEQIKAADHNFSKLCNEILNKRVSFLKELNPHIGKIFKEIFALCHNLQFDISSKFINCTAQQIYNYLQNNISKDIILGHTSYSIHKDDYVILFDGFNSLEYCSLGQQKMSYLGLLFAYIELFRYKCYSYPILLIDDVSGELDKVRWGNLVNYLLGNDFQVLITTANENFRAELEKNKNVTKIYVNSGNAINA